MSGYSSPSSPDSARWTNLFESKKSAADRVTAGKGPVIAGSARGRVLELVGQLRDIAPKKKEDAPKVAEKPPAEPKKEEKAEAPKDKKPEEAKK